MLDFSLLQTQFAHFSRYRVEEEDLHARRLERALEAYGTLDATWEEVCEALRREPPRYLVAGLIEAPAQVFARPERPTPVSVVASDGSQVYPDRHVDPPCYLLNVSRIAFQYGTLERPVMRATPELRYRRRDLEHVLDNLVESLTANIVSAVRDVMELEALLETARQARVEGRPLVAVADGTLIRWMLSSLNRRDLEEKLTRDYVALLGGFASDGIPVCSYISRPANTEVVNLLRCVLGETEDTPYEESLSGLRDRYLFERLLAPGERTVPFESSSHIQRAYEEAGGPENRICYFYLHVPTRLGSELARVEVPRWVAEDPALLDLVHAVLLDQTDKGRGYPVVLAEAHEQAVIRTGEKELFYRLLERHMLAAGITTVSTRKQLSKDVPLI